MVNPATTFEQIYRARSKREIRFSQDFVICLILARDPEYVSIMKALYSHTTGRVRAYGQLSKCFETSSGIRQGCPLTPFLFNFVMDDILGQALRISRMLKMKLYSILSIPTISCAHSKHSRMLNRS